jgi:hypothetical protein
MNMYVMLLSHEREAKQRLDDGYIDVAETQPNIYRPKTMADQYAIKSLMRPSERLPYRYNDLLEFVSLKGLWLRFSDSDSYDYRQKKTLAN